MWPIGKRYLSSCEQYAKKLPYTCTKIYRWFRQRCTLNSLIITLSLEHTIHESCYKLLLIITPGCTNFECSKVMQLWDKADFPLPIVRHRKSYFQVSVNHKHPGHRFKQGVTAISAVFQDRNIQNEKWRQRYCTQKGQNCMQFWPLCVQ